MLQLVRTARCRPGIEGRRKEATPAKARTAAAGSCDIEVGKSDRPPGHCARAVTRPKIGRAVNLAPAGCIAAAAVPSDSRPPQNPHT